MSARDVVLRVGSVLGAIVGYGYLVACLALVGFQVYRWFQNGEWTHVGVNDGMRAALAHLAGAGAVGEFVKLHCSYSTTRTRCATLAIMPRVAGVSTSSATRPILLSRKPTSVSR